MNNTELYVNIGVPSFLVILAWLTNRADIQRMGDRLDKGLDSIRAEIIALRRDVHDGINSYRREIHADMIPRHERVAVMESRIDKK